MCLGSGWDEWVFQKDISGVVCFWQGQMCHTHIEINSAFRSLANLYLASRWQCWADELFPPGRVSTMKHPQWLGNSTKAKNIKPTSICQFDNVIVEVLSFLTFRKNSHHNKRNPRGKNEVRCRPKYPEPHHWGSALKTRGCEFRFRNQTSWFLVNWRREVSRRIERFQCHGPC